MKKIVTVFYLLVLMVTIQHAQGLGMPPKVMADITMKIQKYLENFSGKSVSIIYTAGQEKTMKSLVGAFSGTGLTADGVSATNSGSAKGDIIILLPGLQDSELEMIPIKKHLVIAVDKNVTDKGFASFSIVNNQGKPQILVNMVHISKSGLKVSGKLYRVAKKSA